MRRILLITSVLPWPLRKNGGAQRTELLRRALAKYGEVDIVGIGGTELRESSITDEQLVAANVLACFQRCPAEAKNSSYLPGRLGRMARLLAERRREYAPDDRLVEWVKRSHASRPYSLIVSRFIAPALQAGLQNIRDVPLVVDLDDVDWLKLAASIKANPWPGLNGKIGSFLVLKQVASICKRSLRLFQLVWVTSEEDRELINHHRCSVLPNIFFSESPDMPVAPLPPASESLELLFVGDLQLPANRAGLDRFLAKIWPHVRARVSDATITIVGRGLNHHDRAHWSSIAGTNVVGFAADLRPHYARCAFTVVPVYAGGGTKIKILESLSLGRTVVSTEHALRGYKALLGSSPTVAGAANDDEFASACVTLLCQPALRDELAERGRSMVNQNFSVEQFGTIVDRTVSDLIT